jgi:flagellar protein FlgJ
MQIDGALMQYNNRPLRVPGAASQVQGSGARIADTRAVDKTSPLYEQCREFESIFAKMLLKEMRNTVEKSGLIDGGWAENVFQDMLDDEYAQSMSKTANFGLADQLYRQLA